MASQNAKLERASAAWLPGSCGTEWLARHHLPKGARLFSELQSILILCLTDLRSAKSLLQMNLNKDNTMQDYELQFKRFLLKRGLKFTRSRSLILDASFALHEHFDAEKLHSLLKGMNVSLATVYRTLPLLLDAGLIQLAVRSEGRDRYEHILGHAKHVHWLCEKCKTVTETDMSALLSSIHQEADALKFSVDQVNINVSGLCWKCRTTEDES